ncbi:hypothetical protein WA1_37780 [Scytonema hofmannii PCC 7110]|uniref:Uncharacterized protein n=1 Tax=Scytonema hofmannii PCC 7110 TaxID=128403 RepID=A0A139X073_9CYAN|nr:hypothetical protein [Scytonema hofmannii]KYC38105.1 hypothetical protein WA1_37780 [Scytonema hofmannii PCC 7110]
MQQNLQHDIDKINKLLQQIHQQKNFLDFETIQLPFELVQAEISLWESIFNPETLRQLATTDTETIEAWAIALSQTLNNLLAVLKTWLPHLTTLPIPTTLKQKISERSQEIEQIANEKSKLLQSANELLQEEQQLRKQADEFKSLKEKASQLQKIKAEVQATNLETFRQEISAQEAALEPQRQLLETLQQQKADLDEQIAALQRQQTALKEEILYWQSRQNRIETNIQSAVSELMTLTQQQRERLSEVLSQELAILEQQRDRLAHQEQEYHQAQQQLQKATEDFQKYQSATQEILTAIKNHYQSDRDLGRLLPVDHQKVDSLIRNAQEVLETIDQELAVARSKHEQTQPKNRFFF